MGDLKLNIKKQKPQIFIFEALNYNAIECKDAIRMMKRKDFEHLGTTSVKVARSMIHPDYANRFIREFILEE